MTITRRKLFNFGAAVAATTAIPVVSYASEDSQTVGPILLERICDSDRFKMTAEEIYAWQKDLIEFHGKETLEKYPCFPGCGTRFRWYWGMNCCCPNCGRIYCIRMEDYKSGAFNIKSS